MNYWLYEWNYLELDLMMFTKYIFFFFTVSYLLLYCMYMNISKWKKEGFREK